MFMSSRNSISLKSKRLNRTRVVVRCGEVVVWFTSDFVIEICGCEKDEAREDFEGVDQAVFVCVS